MRALAALLALTLTAGARADEDPKQAEAQVHFLAGQRAFTDGDYDAAVREFEAAYAAKPHPDVLINIATAYERIYKPKAARENYERYLAASPTEGPLAALAKNRLRVLRALPGSILVDATKPGAKVHLSGEGRDLAAQAPHTFQDLPPGSYRVRVELPYHSSHDVDVELEPGGQDVVNVPLVHQVETLTIFTRPPGARVFLDDREEGLTPFSRPVEVGRKRRLRLEAEDFPAWIETVDILPGKPLRRDVTFHKPFRSGRSELVLGAMLYSGVNSIVLAEIVGAQSATASPLDVQTRIGLDIGAGVLGIGIGFLVSAFTTNDYVKVGHSSIIIGSTVWGTALGTGLALGLQLTTRDTMAASLLGGVLGLGTGFVVARVNDTSPGDAAIVNSGGTWGTAAGGLLGIALNLNVEGTEKMVTGWLVLGGCAVGLITTSFLAWGIEVSRGHVAVVDAFGLVGAGSAFAIGYGLGGNAPFANGARWGLGGMAAGLLLGAILSRKYKDDLPATEALLIHHEGTGWAFGIPRLGVALDRTPEGTGAKMTLDLLKGDF